MTTDAFFDKANDAIERQNYGYAIELLSHIVQSEPKNVKARQLLWLAERRKFAADPEAKKGLAMKTMGPWVSSVIHSLMGKPLLVIEDCEKYLMINPESAQMRDRLGQSALQVNDVDLAIAAYESAREVEPKNQASLKHLGRLYAGKYQDTQDMEFLDLAMSRYNELHKLNPSDAEANQESQRLAAEKTIKKGGWATTDEQADFRRVLKDQKETEELEKDQKITKAEDEGDKELAELAERIKAEPDRANLYVRRGDLLLSKQQFKSAEASFLKAQELDGTNTFTRARLGDVKIAYMKSQIDALKESLAQKPGDAALKAQVETQSEQLRAYKIQDYRQRVQEQPTNMEVHHDLGKLLIESKDYDGAMQMFQKSMADPRYRIIATHMLGKCLVEKGMFDRAVNMFKRAVEGAHVMNETVKSVYYDLGATYEKMKKYSDAEAAYGRIYDADVGYRDVGRKMEEVYRKARGEDEKSV